MMDDERYDLVFTGELLSGAELAQVKRNLQALFRINEQQVDLLFSGREVVLKKNLDAQAANKYRVAIKKAGARIRLVGSASPVSQAPPVAKEPSAQTQSLPVAEVREQRSLASAQEAQSHGEEMRTSLGAQAAKPAQSRAEIRAPDLPLAEPGADLLRPEERISVQARAIDTSALSVAPQSGNLLSSEELNRAPAAPVDVPDYEVAPPGSDVLRPDERAEFVALELDLSGLDLAAVGTPLAPKQPAAPPAPNVDHIRLKDG